MQTPWGESQDVTSTGRGILRVDTARHGGYFLDHDRQKRVRLMFPKFQPFAGWPWFEEDQDWAVVALAFPESFTPAQLRGAVRTVALSVRMETEHATDDRIVGGRGARGWRDVAAWLESPASAYARETVATFEAEHAEQWETGGGGTLSTDPEFSWYSHLTRIGDGAKQTRCFREYPRRGMYSDAELDALSVPERRAA